METKNLIICSEDCVEEVLEEIGKSDCNLISVEYKYIGNNISEYWFVFEGELKDKSWLAENDFCWLDDYGYIDDDIDEDDDNYEEYLENKGKEVIDNYIKSVSAHDLEWYEDDEELYNILKELYYKGKIIINGYKMVIKKVKVK